MKKRTTLHIMQVPLVLLLVATLVAGLVMIPNAETAKPEGFTIDRLDGVEVDYQSYLDNSVMYQLPETIRDDEEISVIITLNQINLMDAYAGTDKAMSFRDYALESSEAQQLRTAITQDRAQLMEKLEQHLATGEDFGEEFTPDFG